MRLPFAPKRESFRSEGLNRLAEFGFLAYVKLSDYEKAIDFFKIHYSRRDTEVSLFVLLQWLRSLEREDLWRREYEKSLKAGIKPRDSLGCVPPSEVPWCTSSKLLRFLTDSCTQGGVAHYRIVSPPTAGLTDISNRDDTQMMPWLSPEPYR